jgi:hypothetical protein
MAWDVKSRSVESQPVRRWVEGAFIRRQVDAVLFYARDVLRPFCRGRVCAALTRTTRHTMSFHTAIKRLKPDTRHVNLCLLITQETATRHYSTRPVMAPRILHCRTHPPLPHPPPHGPPPYLPHRPAAERRGSLWRAHL